MQSWRKTVDTLDYGEKDRRGSKIPGVMTEFHSQETDQAKKSPWVYAMVRMKRRLYVNRCRNSQPLIEKKFSTVIPVSRSDVRMFFAKLNDNIQAFF
jgi:hypothetical protein